MLRGRADVADFFAVRFTDSSPAGVNAALQRFEEQFRTTRTAGDRRLRGSREHAEHDPHPHRAARCDGDRRRGDRRDGTDQHTRPQHHRTAARARHPALDWCERRRADAPPCQRGARARCAAAMCSASRAGMRLRAISSRSRGRNSSGCSSRFRRWCSCFTGLLTLVGRGGFQRRARFLAARLRPIEAVRYE